MLAARDLAVERSPNRGYRDDRQPRARTRPKAAARPRSKAAWLGLWVLAVLVAFSVTYRHAAVTRLGYEAEALERELSLVRKLNGELQTRVSAAGSLGRVQQLAQSKLGMVLPRQSVVIAMPSVSADDQLAAAKSGLDPVAARQQSPDGGGALSRLWRLVLRLTGVPAEAAAVPR